MNKVKFKLLNILPYVAVAAIVYFVLLLIFNEQYTYIYTEWFIDEWVVIAIATPIYALLAFIVSWAVHFIIINQEIRNRFILFCMVIGVVAVIITGMKMYDNYKEAKHQEELDIANKNSKWVEESYQRIQRDYLDADLKATGKK